MTMAGGHLRATDAPASRGPAPHYSSMAAGHVDPFALAEALIGGLIGLVALSPHAKRRLGLRGASRRADGWPAWYLWLAGCNGAYELALIPPENADRDGIDFTLRYFPHPEEDDFDAFAAIEREARKSSLFDHTGTPAIEALADIDPSLFHIATMSLAPSRHEDSIDLLLTSQDVWSETIEADGEIAVRRRVPGLALAAPLIDFIVCGHTYHGRHPPASFALTREPGLAWHVDAMGAHPVAADAAAYSLRVEGLPGLGAPGIPGIGDQPDERPAPAEKWVVHRHAGDEMPARCEPFATDDWWRAARWTFYPVGAMCGCQVDEATVVGRDEESLSRRRR